MKCRVFSPQLHTYRQLLASLVGAQTFCILGAAVAVGGVLFHQETLKLSKKSSAAPTAHSWSPVLITWLVSTFTLGNVPGNMISTAIYQRLGAIKLIVYSAPLAAAGALMVGFGGSSNFPLLLAGRALIGFYFGLTEGPARAYIGEISSSRIRSVIGNILNVVSPLYMVIGFALGSFLSWRSIELSLVLSSAIIQTLGVVQLEESPKWLIAHGRNSRLIEKSLYFFMGSDVDVNEEIKKVQRSLDGSSNNINEKANEENGTKQRSVLGRLYDLVAFSENRRPTLLLLLQFTCMIFSGGMAISQFAPSIFGGLGSTHANHSGGDSNNILTHSALSRINTSYVVDNSSIIPGMIRFDPTSSTTNSDTATLNPYISSVYLAALTAVGLLASGPLLERFGRVRTLQVCSIFGALGCLVLAACFRWPLAVARLTSSSTHGTAWVSLGACGLLITGYSVGYLPATFVLLVELLPNAVRSVAINVVLLYLSLGQWLQVHFYPAATNALGTDMVILGFSLVNLLQLLLATFFLPETAGLSLEEIHRRHFSRKQKSNEGEDRRKEKQSSTNKISIKT